MLGYILAAHFAHKTKTLTFWTQKKVIGHTNMRIETPSFADIRDGFKHKDNVGRVFFSLFN